MSKRARRAPSPTASASGSSEDGEAGPSRAKSQRADISTVTAPLLCTLAPTCCPPHGTPTPLASTRELEAHYARAHAHVCAATGCGKVFPDARLLQLHHTECHDSLAAVRKERGEKIFACHVSSCPKLCATPKSRRLHLIEAHGYPKQYFFAVTNKGIGGLLARWGEGATMLRGDWKPREAAPNAADMDLDREPAATAATAASHSDDDSSADQSPSKPPRNVRFLSPVPPRSPTPPADEDRPGLGDGVDKLAAELGNMSVSLVPRGVRFGRGNARGGFVSGPAPRGGGSGRGRGGGSVPGQVKILANPGAVSPSPASPDAMEEDQQDQAEDGTAEKKKTRRTNRGGRGRSRNKNKSGSIDLTNAPGPESVEA